MPTLFWDASGLAKRYTEEMGKETAEVLFQQSTEVWAVTTPWGYSETFSLLIRKRNDGRISRRLFADAVSRLRRDLIDLPQFRLLTVTDADIISSITLIHRHNINSVDAALLATLLRYSQATGETCVLVVADKRMLRAAQAEGLSVINPEAMLAADVPSLLAAL